jgi:hypothetical protein
MFDKHPTKAPAAPKEAVVEVGIAGMRDVAVIAKALEALKTEYDTRLGGIKDGPVLDYFVNTGAKTKSRPDNFRAVEEDGQASVVLRDRTTGLKESEIALCKANRIKTRKVVTVPGTYLFNPEHNTAEMRALITSLLQGKEGIPADLFMWQDEQSATMPEEGAMEALFKTGKADRIRTMIPVLGQIAVTPTLKENELEKHLDRVKTLITDAAVALTKAVAAAIQAKADKAAAKAAGKGKKGVPVAG